MGQILTSERIEAPPQLIWDSLFTLDSKFKNTLILSMEGHPFAVGTRIKIDIGMKFTPLMLNNEAPKVFRWRGQVLMPHIFDGEHSFVLESQEDGSTLFIHTEVFSGVLCWFGMGWLVARMTQPKFGRMNGALKEYCEELYKNFK